MHTSQPGFWPGVWLVSNTGGLLLAAWSILQNSQGSGHAVALGVSAPSLALALFTLLFGFIFLGLGLLSLRGGDARLERAARLALNQPRHSLGILLTLLALAWAFAWTPAERFGSFYYYALRVAPLAGWLVYAAASGILLLLTAWKGWDKALWRQTLHENRAAFTAAGLALAAALVLAGLIFLRVLKISPGEEDYWYGAGVPVLLWQVFFAIALGAGFAWVEKNSRHNGKAGSGRVKLPVDALVFVLIWVTAAFLWVRIPLQTNFVMTKPYPPNETVYPSADSSFFDLNSQFALLGQKLFNGSSYDRPLLSAVLFYLHLAGGQDYALIANFLAALLALFPAVVYLLVREIDSRGAAAAVSALLTLRGMNGLAAGSLLENSNQKMLLTDFPTTLMLALALLFAVRWAKAPRVNWAYGGWTAGALGLAAMLRPHALLLFLALFALAAWLYRARIQIFGLVAVFLLASYLAAALPWAQLNGSGVSLLGYYQGRINTVIQERYPNFHWPWQGGLAPTGAAQVASLGCFSPVENTADKPFTAFVADHFLNSVMTSALALPQSPTAYPLKFLVREAESYWHPYWDGQLSTWARFFMFFNILLICLGIGFAWKRSGLAGLLPLAAMLLYFVMNGVGRTSGGRYIVPVDWVLVMYYLLGWLALLKLLAAGFGWREAAEVELPAARPGLPAAAQAGLTLAVLAGLGCLAPLPNYLVVSPRFERQDKPALAQTLEQYYLTQLGIDSATLESFARDPNSVILQGAALYPRFVGRGVNALIPGPLLFVKRYSRMSLTLLAPQGENAVILPGRDQVFALPHTATVIVLGCRTPEFIDAWALILPEDGSVHLRWPQAPLACPLPEPVCDNNGNCQ